MSLALTTSARRSLRLWISPARCTRSRTGDCVTGLATVYIWPAPHYDLLADDWEIV